MHVVFRESHGLEETETPTDLGQTPADLVVLSFSDSDLGAFADAAFDIVVCVDVLEHVAELSRVLGEVERVLAPGGWFLFDTIDRTWLSRLAVVTLAEDVLRLLPTGTHDPAKFIRPQELAASLEGAGMRPGPVTGLGPRGLNRRGDPVFGRLPLTAILYMGTARKPG